MITQKLSFRMLRLLAVGVATMLILTLTSPAKIPAMFLVLPFMGIFVFLFLLILEVVRFLGPSEEEESAVVRIRRPRVLAALVAGFPVLLLVLQSIVELTTRDVLIAFAILLLAYLYVSRSSVSFWRR